MFLLHNVSGYLDTRYAIHVQAYSSQFLIARMQGSRQLVTLLQPDQAPSIQARRCLVSYCQTYQFLTV
jgi:hypothetical protein